MVVPIYSYKRVYKNNQVADGAVREGVDEEIQNKFDELIPTDKFEAKKNKYDMLNEIYAHTDRRVTENQKKLVELQNK